MPRRSPGCPAASWPPRPPAPGARPPRPQAHPELPVHADTWAGSANISDVPGWAVPLVRSCRAAGEDIDCAVDLADRYGRLLPLPGHGQTARRWAVLAAVAEQNLTVARVLEAHSD